MNVTEGELRDWAEELERIKRMAGTDAENVKLEVDERMMQIRVFYPRSEE